MDTGFVCYKYFCEGIGLLWVIIFKQQSSGSINIEADKITADITEKQIEASVVADEHEIQLKLDKILNIPKSIDTLSEIGEKLLINLSK